MVISVGRVMTCVLGMVVKREREIREFVKTPFYRVIAKLQIGDEAIEGEWKSTPESKWQSETILYKDNGFLKEEDAKAMIATLLEESGNGEYPLPSR